VGKNVVRTARPPAYHVSAPPTRMPPMTTTPTTSPLTGLPTNLADLQASGWTSLSVKDEIRGNMVDRLAAGDDLFPGHRRLRRHGDPRDRQRGSRRARHALPGREGPGQEPHDAHAHPVPRRGGAVPRHPRLPGARGPVQPDHQTRPRARGEKPEAMCRSRGGRARSATPSGWRRARSSPTSSARSIPPSSLAGTSMCGGGAALRADPAHAPRPCSR
jgi:hypothetical protein